MVLPTARGKALLTRPPLVAPPPAGGPFDFTPSDYEVLLRPSGLLQSAGTLTGWTNDGSLGGSFVASGSPVYQANAINGLAGAQFTYTNGLAANSALMLGGGTQSIICLVACDSYLDQPVFIHHGVTTTDGFALDVSSSGSGTPQAILSFGDGYQGGDRPPTCNSANNVFTGAAFHIIRVDLGAGGNLIEFDGQTLVPAMNVPGVVPALSAVTTVAGQTYVRIVFMVLALDKPDSLLDKVVGKIAWDAGLTLHASHPYASARP